MLRLFLGSCASLSEIIKHATLFKLSALGHVTPLFTIVSLLVWYYQATLLNLTALGHVTLLSFWVWNYKTSHAIDAVETHSCSFFLRSLKLSNKSNYWSCRHWAMLHFSLWSLKLSNKPRYSSCRHWAMLHFFLWSLKVSNKLRYSSCRHWAMLHFFLSSLKLSKKPCYWRSGCSCYTSLSGGEFQSASEIHQTIHM